METLLLAIDTAAQFIGDMEGIGLQQHLLFLMLAHETSFQQVEQCRSFTKSHRKHLKKGSIGNNECIDLTLALMKAAFCM